VTSSMLEFVQTSGLPVILAVTFGLIFIHCLVIVFATRFALHARGYGAGKPLAVNSSMITAASGLFALMMAFSAASIWTDYLQARAAVLREATALENVFVLSHGLPAEFQDTIQNSVVNYAEGVVERDWPAMARRIDISDPIYGNSDRVLVHLIDYLSTNAAQAAAPPIISALLSQLFEVRSARVNRLTLASTGLSLAQWCALIILASVVFATVAVVHHQQFGAQIVSLGLYGSAAAAAFFVIVAHEWLFVGTGSVSPGPLLDLATKTIH
jgi:hypothetical protein